jgi:antitoxin component of MazEF toxin-antitoxin module
MESKKVRNIKVISQSGRNYKPTPTVILKGQWLNEMGFEIGDQIKVECENGKLVISLDREKMEMLEAERAFMEAETQKLQARFKKEKEEIYARYVAERRVAYGL